MRGDSRLKSTYEISMKNSSKLKRRFVVATILAGAVTLSGTVFALPPPPNPHTTKAAASPAAAEAATDTGKKDAAGRGGSAALSSRDKTFIKDAAKDGMMEVEMGKMGQQKGQSDEVKKIGARMVADHSRANSELMALARSKGVDVSGVKPAKHGIGGHNFDKDYIDQMVKDHEKSVSEFRAQANHGSDPDVKKFAAKTLKVLEKHLKLVKNAQGKTGGSKTEEKAESKPEKKDEAKAEKTEDKADDKAESKKEGEG